MRNPMKKQTDYTPSPYYAVIEATRRYDFLAISLLCFAATGLAIFKLA